MPTEPLIAAIREQIPDAIAVYLFGSAARGDPIAGSDMDVAVLAPRRLDPVERWALQERLAGLVHRDVDLVDLRAASAVTRVQVLRDARLLFEGDGYQRALFEATALADYARLNEERRGILEDIRRSGRVYG